MKFLVILFLACGAATVAGQEGASRLLPEKAAESTCAAEAQHAHRFSDLRMLAVEIRQTDSCGFSYVDVESNTVGPDNYLQFAHDFALLHFSDDRPDSVDLRLERVAKAAVKKGARGVAVYCLHCRVALGIRLLPKEMRTGVK